ncbi:hypothetical protein CFIO01_09229 [Colletotrichum fioriniae PJ7]|uniref:Uncharacterized protein n=1 Tax=Colletotrichum fioriniae PJ7 TaxID=1445577 RepID=A0A010QE68_9PEZI|nr:hypothetical protein CFIO01_09229 [Colletotrichum fioriniae PJ7]
MMNFPTNPPRFASQLSHYSTHDLMSTFKAPSIDPKVARDTTTVHSPAKPRVLGNFSEEPRNVAGDVRRKIDGLARAQPPPLQQPGARKYRRRALDSENTGDYDGDSSDLESASCLSNQSLSAVHAFDAIGIHRHVLEGGASKEPVLSEDLQEVSKRLDEIRQLRTRNREEGSMRREQLLKWHHDRHSQRHSRILSSLDRERPGQPDSVLQELIDGEHTAWTTDMEKQVRQWDAALRDDISPTTQPHHGENYSSPDIVEDIIRVVEENVLKSFTEAEYSFPRPSITGEKYEHIADAAEHFTSTYFLGATLKWNPAGGIGPYEALHRVTSVCFTRRPEVFGVTDDLSLMTQFLVDSYMSKMTEHLAVDLGRAHGIFVQRGPRLHTLRRQELFCDWLRRIRSNKRSSIEYVDWVLSGVDSKQLSRCCRDWKTPLKDLRARKEFFLGISLPGIVSMVIFEENSPIMVKNMPAHETEKLGWFQSSSSDELLGHWRYELRHAYGRGFERGESFVYRVTMDDEVLGMHSPDGRWHAWEEVSRELPSI